MAIGKPIKAAKGGEMKKSATKASAGAKADRQGRALLPGKMAKNLPMIAPQSAYKKGGDVKPSAYDKMQDKKLMMHQRSNLMFKIKQMLKFNQACQTLKN